MPEDDKIQKITRLLEKGGTMLATHHECGAPLFRFQGKAVCPVCNFQEKEEKKRKEPEPKPATPTKPEAIKVQQTVDSQTISRIVTSKTNDIASGLEAETDLQRIKDKMDCIERGIRILKLLQG